MNKRILEKLTNNKGESLAETLVALLIALLGLTILAGMVHSSSKIILSSNEKIQEYAKKENILAEKAGKEKTGSISLIVKNHPEQPINLNPETTSAGVSVYYYEEEMGDLKIISFRQAN